MRRSVSVVVLLVVFGLGAGCRSMTGESFGRNIDDATISTEVKAKLTGEKASNLTRVSVATANGPADRARAEEITRGVKASRE
jgi:osmotically-inducible protein OsmY